MELAERIRAIVGDDPNIGEIRMFGGLCFTLNGNMLVIARGKSGLLARVGEDGEADALARPGVERMVMNGRRMTGFVTVPEDGLDEKSLGEWIARATSYVGPLPAKVKKPRAPRKRAKTG